MVDKAYDDKKSIIDLVHAVHQQIHDSSGIRIVDCIGRSFSTGFGAKHDAGLECTVQEMIRWRSGSPPDPGVRNWALNYQQVRLNELLVREAYKDTDEESFELPIHEKLPHFMAKTVAFMKTSGEVASIRQALYQLYGTCWAKVLD
jgi:hypothetical protein